MSKRNRLKRIKSRTKRSESAVSIRTIISNDERFVVGMKVINENPATVQLILLKPPCVKSVLKSLSPEELLAARDFIGRVAGALAEKGVRIVR